MTLWCILWVLVIISGIASDQYETTGEAIGVSVVALVLAGIGIGVGLGWGWVVDGARRRSAEKRRARTAISAPPQRMDPEPHPPPMPVQSSPSLQQPTTWVPSSTPSTPDENVSAFEETAHVHLPVATPQVRPVNLGDLLTMTPTEFEQLCVRALIKIGYTNVKRVGGAGDLAADITAHDMQGRSCIVQCKRYAPGSGVGSPVVQTFIGMKAVHHRADRGIVITTAEFTKPAIALAKLHEIVLIDGDDLVKILNLMGAR